MKFNTQSPPTLLCLFFSILIFASCSKDSDLMADYVALDPEVLVGTFVRSDTYQVSIISNSEDDTVEININSGSSGTITNSGTSGTTVNDTYQTSSSVSIVLDVLANDTFQKPEEVLIIEVSQPNNGNVVINSDNTLTYAPNTLLPGEDNFTYTTEFINENGKLSNEIGTVKVEIIPPTSANLLFKSGFEGVNVGAQTGDYKFITGTDSETGYSWPPTFWNSGVAGTPNGIHTISSQFGATYTNELVTMTGHTGAQTTALKVGIDAFPQPYKNTQTPYQINDIGGSQLGGVGEPEEIYHKFWIRLDDMSAVINGSNGNTSRMIWQFKSINFDDNWVIGDGDDDAYRISLYVYYNATDGLYFSTVADWQPREENAWWIQKNYMTVPTEEWFKVEIYDKVSDGEDGIFWIKINDVQIAYKEGRNLGNNNPTSWGPDIKAPDNLRYWTLWQFYSAYTGVQWIDDIEIWDGIPY